MIDESRWKHQFGTNHPVALVTGSGAARVGNAVARSLAEHGFRVALHAKRSLEGARNTARELAANGWSTCVLAADVSCEEEVQRMVQEVKDTWGRLDVLVNSAAIWEPRPLEQTDGADARRHWEVNTFGTWLCCLYAGRQMVNQPNGGVVINIGDWAACRPYVDHAAYFPSKSAIPGLTQNFAVELASRNPRVRVNAILPGPVMIPADMPEPLRQFEIQSTLVRREGTPAHVAHAVLFLIENDFVTGVCLPVDGGRTIFAGDEAQRRFPK